MKILHIAETLKGGVCTYLNELISSQINEKEITSVKICYPSAHDPYLTVPTLSRLPYLSNTSRTPLSILKLCLNLKKIIRNEAPDIIHIHSTFAGLMVRAFNPFLFLRAKVIYCPHGWAFFGERRNFYNKLIIIFELFMQLFTTNIINISLYEHEKSLRLGFSKKKCLLIENAINFKKITYSKPEEYDESYCNILFVGRFDHQKGIDIFLRLCERLHESGVNARFHVIGEPVVSKNNLNLEEFGYINFIGWASREKIFDYMHFSDVLIMPSRWEGFGLVAIEAMACGCPVIGSDRGALSELLKEKGCSALNLNDFVENAEKLITSNIRNFKVNRPDSNEVLQRYSHEKMTLKIIEVYKG